MKRSLVTSSMLVLVLSWSAPTSADVTLEATVTWAKCMALASDVFALKTGEAAETIVVAAFGTCHEEENEVHRLRIAKAIKMGVSSQVVDRVMQNSRTWWREWLTARILLTRATR